MGIGYLSQTFAAFFSCLAPKDPSIPSTSLAQRLVSSRSIFYSANMYQQAQQSTAHPDTAESRLETVIVAYPDRPLPPLARQTQIPARRFGPGAADL